MSVEDLSSLFDCLSVRSNNNNNNMDANQLQTIIESAVAGALQAQRVAMESTINELRSSIQSLSVQNAPPRVEEYVDCIIDRSISCEEGLDVVKSLPEFSGNKKEYLTFRRAAENAYKVFSPFDGSVKHFQAVSIIRNKIKGPASDKLTGFGTAFNFKAIISRLDNEYGDKRPIHLLEQELSTLRQGGLSVQEYYDEVQIKLTALTNKCLMQYPDAEFARQLNSKYRRDALRVFISGLKKGISETLFSSRPEDLPSALALAEELESNRERYQFAANFNRSAEAPQNNIPRARATDNFRPANPNYVAAPRPAARVMQTQPLPEPMEVDSSMRAQFSKRTGNVWKPRQVINNISTEILEEEIRDIVEDDEDLCVLDNINFLGVSRTSSSSKG